MKLPLLENLRTVRANRVTRTPCTAVSYEANALESHTVIPTQYEYRTGAEVFFEQFAKDDTPIDVLQSQATRAIMREVYGPVFNELLMIREILWSEGYTGKALAEIEEMLNSLSAQ